jgi:hypothetical protein
MMRTFIGLLIVAATLLGASRPQAAELTNRDTAATSEVANVADQEQLRRYFLHGWR